jgi:uncharacterized membrane protein YfcA
VILPLLSIGVIGGVFAGLFGVGGGFIMVPLLMALAHLDQRHASATSLLAIVPTAAVSAAQYGLRGEIDGLAAAVLAVGALAGAPLGTLLLRRISLVWLKWLFIAGLVATAARLVIAVPQRDGSLEYGAGAVIGLIALGIVMGLMAGLLGVGGGIVAVAALIAIFGMGDLVAKGTSLLAMIPGAIAGTISNRRGNLVSVRSGLIVGLAAAVSSFVGVGLAFWMPPAVSAWLFAALLAIVIVQMIRRPTARPPA